MKRLYAIVILLVIVLVAASLVFAASLSRHVSVTWDQYVERGPYVTVPDWRLCLDLELRQGGRMVISQTVATGYGPADIPGSGLFANIEWSWESDDWTGQAEEWVRLRWSAPGEEPVYGIYAPDAGGTREDARHFWYFGTLQGTGYRVYLPVVMSGVGP
jgi:hypothetical protein